MTPRRWRRLMGSEAVTQPIPLATQLRGTPYSDLVRMQTPEQQDLRRSLDLVMGIAALGLRAGAGTAEVKTTVLASAAALGLRDDALEVDITFGSVLLGYAPPGQPPSRSCGSCRPRDGTTHGCRRSTRSSSTWSKVVSTGAARTTGWWRSRACRGRTTVPWSARRGAVWPRRSSRCSAARSRRPATAFVVTAIVDQVGRFASRRGLPPFFVTYIGAALAASLALLVGDAQRAAPYPGSRERPRDGSRRRRRHHRPAGRPRARGGGPGRHQRVPGHRGRPALLGDADDRGHPRRRRDRVHARRPGRSGVKRSRRPSRGTANRRDGEGRAAGRPRSDVLRPGQPGPCARPARHRRRRWRRLPDRPRRPQRRTAGCDLGRRRLHVHRSGRPGLGAAAPRVSPGGRGARPPRCSCRAS